MRRAVGQLLILPYFYKNPVDWSMQLIVVRPEYWPYHQPYCFSVSWKPSESHPVIRVSPLDRHVNGNYLICYRWTNLRSSRSTWLQPRSTGVCQKIFFSIIKYDGQWRSLGACAIGNCIKSPHIVASHALLRFRNQTVFVLAFLVHYLLQWSMKIKNITMHPWSGYFSGYIWITTTPQ